MTTLVTTGLRSLRLLQRYGARTYRKDHGLKSYHPEVAAALAARRGNALAAQSP